jgi:alkylhydroperoxidase family enzyme
MRMFHALAVAILGFATQSALAQPDAKSPSSRFPAASAAEAWNGLRGDQAPVPNWALTLAKPLPRTAAAMLHLEYIHRAQNPLGPILAAKLHWAAADSIGCDYARRNAEADLRRAGLNPEEFKSSIGELTKAPVLDRKVIEFARKMTTAANTVTDEEVALLLKELGPEKVVAMVHTLAWANFQNRIILALGIQVEPNGPVPPVDSPLDRAAQAKLMAPARPPWKQVQQAKVSLAPLLRPDWEKRSEAELASAMEQQKARPPRIPLPDESRLASLPPEVRGRASKIIWSRVSMGYQPLLTQTWFETMGIFQQEARLDSVFSNSMFWIITRSNECFY